VTCQAVIAGRPGCSTLAYQRYRQYEQRHP
jgi:hypothetical protein